MQKRASALFMLVAGFTAIALIVWGVFLDSSSVDESKRIPSELNGVEDAPSTRSAAGGSAPDSSLRATESSLPQESESVKPGPDSIAEAQRLAASTAELLKAMRHAYESDNLDLMFAIRDRLLAMPEFEIEVAKQFFLALLFENFTRRPGPGATSLENELVTVLLERWDVSGEAAFLDICLFVTKAGESNPATELEGRWERIESQPQIEEQAYPTLSECQDARCLLNLLERSRAKFLGGQSFSSRMAVVELFKDCRSYREDRNSCLQIGVILFLVKMNAVQHLADLLALARRAKIVFVRTAALDAYLKIGGSEAMGSLIADLAISVSTDRGSERRASEALMESLLSRSEDFPTATKIVNTVLGSLCAADPTGKRWTELSSRLALKAMSRPGGKANWKYVLSLINRETNPAVTMLWSSVLGSWRQGEYDAELEEVLKRLLLEVVTGPDGDPIALIMQISYVWHGYASVVRSPEYLHLWFETAEAAVLRATPQRRRLFSSKIAGSAYWAVEVEKETNGPYHKRAVGLILELARNEIPGTLSDPTSKRTGATENWKSGVVRIRTPEMAAGLRNYANTWSSVEREFMEECLLAWHAFETNGSVAKD